jgi:hypothetical protein
MLSERERPEACITDLTFDRWLAQEVTADEEAGLSAHLASCARCRERRQLLSEEHEAVLLRMPTFDTVGRSPAPSLAEAKPRRGRWRRGALLTATIPVLAAAAALLIMRQPREDGPTTRSKGGPELSFFVKHGEETTRGEDGTRVVPGDQLRFTTSSDRERYFAVLSRDGKGTVNVYAPRGEDMLLLRPGSDLPLDSAVLLDDVLGEETLYGLFCAQPHRLDALTEALRLGGAFPPADCEVTTRTLHKVVAP